MRKRKSLAFRPALALLTLAVSQVHAADASNADQLAAREHRADKAALATLAKMTTQEKLEYIGGEPGWDIKALPQYGVARIYGADGGMGVRMNDHGNEQGVVFPSGTNVAATFNQRRALDLGHALGYDTASGGYQFITGPGMNLYRMPWGGRNFEYLSGEDPFLGAAMAPALINGVQENGVWAEAKHFVANDQESNRFILNQVMPERVLREMSLTPFESASKNGSVGMMMCSFQKINGEFVCENKHLLTEIVKKEWGYKGIIQSDYNAVVNGLPAAKAGTDLDMIGGQMNPQVLTPYLENGELDIATIDDKVRRILRNIYLYNFDKYTQPTEFDMNSATSNKVSLSVAREGIVLLQNKGDLLPLDKNKVKRIAVVGDLAKYAPPSGFGSSYYVPRHYISEVSGLQQMAKHAKVDFIDGLSLDPAASPWTTENSQGETITGMKAEYFNNADLSGEPAATRIDAHVDLDWTQDGAPIQADENANSVRWTGKITPTVSGEQVFKIRADGAVRLWVNGEQIINNGDGENVTHGSIPPAIPESGKIKLEAGQTYDVKLEYSRRSGYASTLGVLSGVQMAWASLEAPQDLSQYDAVVVAVGNSNEYEGEGFDHGFDLPEYQSDLIQNIVKTNPNTIVTLHGGTGLNMSEWIDKVPAVLHAFYPGQNGGQALAEILFGRVNPSAKMPFSIERHIEDNPLYPDFPKFDNSGELKEISYAHDLTMLGYRGYDKLGTKPLFAFGHGLSYTHFTYNNIKVTPGSVVGNAPIKVSFDLTNSGDRAGAEVAQLYVGQRHPKVERAIKELKGFKKVYLKPGQTRHVTIELNDRSLAYFDDSSNQWVVDADTFDLSLGSASDDIRLKSKIVNPYRQELSTTSSNPLPRAALNATRAKLPPIDSSGVFEQTEDTTPAPNNNDAYQNPNY